MSIITGVQQSCGTTNDRGGGSYRCVPTPATIAVVTGDRGGGQFNPAAPNPGYIPPGLFQEGSAAQDKLLGNIDPASVTTRGEFDRLSKLNAPVLITPASYVPDRGGNAIGGIKFFSSPQNEANTNELYQIGVARGFIDPNAGNLHGIAKIVGDVVQGVVIAGIAWGGGLALSQATTPAVSAAAASDAGTLYPPIGSNAVAPINSAAISTPAISGTAALQKVGTAAISTLISSGISSLLSPKKSSAPATAPDSGSAFNFFGNNTPVDTSNEQYSGVNPFSNWYIIGAVLIAMIFIAMKARG